MKMIGAARCGLTGTKGRCLSGYKIMFGLLLLLALSMRLCLCVSAAPVIGINTNYVMGDAHTNLPRTYVPSYYVDAIVAAGGVPVLLPFIANCNQGIVDEFMNNIDGLLIIGGPDVDPALYGEKLNTRTGETNKAKDSYDISLIKSAFALKKPILGICRGQQLINVAFGGTLYQDIPSMIDGALPHDQSKLKANWGDSTHEIELPQGSVLYSIFDKKQLSVNSYHHQAIKKLAAGFAVAAIAQDGVIESISYIRDGNFVMATQFHPEMMPGQQSECARLFSYFVNQAVKTGAKQQNNQNIKETTGR